MYCLKCILHISYIIIKQLQLIILIFNIIFNYNCNTQFYFVELYNCTPLKQRQDINVNNLVHKNITYEHQPPGFEWHCTCISSEFSLMNVRWVNSIIVFICVYLCSGS